MAGRRYYAAYLQSVNQISGSRWQALVCPPIPKQEGDEFPATFAGRFIWWERYQTVDKQRPKWVRYLEAGHVNPSQRLAVEGSGMNWQVADPIVVHVLRDDIAEWLKDSKTPYPLIRILERRAVARNIQIQGPTSKPQVVTSVPTS